jgi:hypothetical protein
LTRTSLTFADPVTHPATLLSPLVVVAGASNSTSSIRTPVVSALTTSADPDAGFTTGRFEAE